MVAVFNYIRRINAAWNANDVIKASNFFFGNLAVRTAGLLFSNVSLTFD
jgi:hypothetical protein